MSRSFPWRWTIGSAGLVLLFALYSWWIENSLLSEVIQADVEHRIVFIDAETNLRIPSVKFEMELMDGHTWTGIADETGSAAYFRKFDSVESHSGRRRFLGIAFGKRHEFVPFSPWKTITAKRRPYFLWNSIASLNYKYLGQDDERRCWIFEYEIPLSKIDQGTQ